MKKLISFTVFALMILMLVAFRSVQAQAVVVRPVVPVAAVRIAPYPMPGYGVRAYYGPRRMAYPIMARNYYRPRFYRRPGIRVRVW